MNDNAAIMFSYAVAALHELEAMKLQNQLDLVAGRELTYTPQHYWGAHQNMETLIRDLR